MTTKDYVILATVTLLVVYILYERTVDFLKEHRRLTTNIRFYQEEIAQEEERIKTIRR